MTNSQCSTGRHLHPHPKADASAASTSRLERGAWSVERGAIDASNSVANVASVALPLFNFYFTFIWLLVWFFFLLFFSLFLFSNAIIYPFSHSLFSPFAHCHYLLFSVVLTHSVNITKRREKNQFDSAPKKIVVQSQCLSGCSSLSDCVGVGKKKEHGQNSNGEWCETGKRASG